MMKNFWQIITALMAVALVVLAIRGSVDKVEVDTIEVEEVEQQQSVDVGEVVVSIKDSVMIINSTAIASDIKGFNGTTPVKIYLKEGVIQGVEPLENIEDTYYFDLLLEDKLFDSWNGLRLDEVVAAEVDAVSGATYSSQSVIKTVQRAASFK